MRALIGLLLLLLLAGCGDGGAGDDTRDKPKQTPEQAAETAVRTWGLTTDPDVGCGTLATARLLREYYLSRERCEQGAQANRSVRVQAAVSDVRVTGDRATARLRNRFDDLAPVEGTVEAVRDDGAWKVDAVQADYMQSFLIAAASGAQRGLLTQADGRRCFARGVRRLNFKQARRTLLLLEEDPKGKGIKRVVGLLDSCPDVVEAYVVRTVVTQLADVSPSPIFKRCLSQRLTAFTRLRALRLAEAALTGDPTGRFRSFTDSLGFTCLGAVEGSRR